MNAALNLSVVILFTSAVLAAVRAIRSGKLADRAVAFEALTPVLTCGMLIAVALTDEDRFVDLALVLGLLAFLTTITVARYMESRDK